MCCPSFQSHSLLAHGFRFLLGVRSLAVSGVPRTAAHLELLIDKMLYISHPDGPRVGKYWRRLISKNGTNFMKKDGYPGLYSLPDAGVLLNLLSEQLEEYQEVFMEVASNLLSCVHILYF